MTMWRIMVVTYEQQRRYLFFKLRCLTTSICVWRKILDLREAEDSLENVLPMYFNHDVSLHLKFRVIANIQKQ